MRHATIIATALATAALGSAAGGAQADPHPDHRARPGHTHTMKSDAAGYSAPNKYARELKTFAREGDGVRMLCQEYGGRNGGRIYTGRGGNLWSLVKQAGQTFFVPDRLVSTDTDGRAQGIRDCKARDFKRVTKLPRRPQQQMENNRGSLYG